MVYNLWIDQTNNYSGRPSYDKIISYIKKAKEAGDEILIGGSGMLVSCIYLAFVHSLIVLTLIQATTRGDILSNLL